jgi:hypothetical protein
MAPTRPTWLTATVAVWIATALLFALAFPVAVLLDSVLDRVKPMYADRAEMLWLQSQNVKVTGQAVPVELSPGESVEVGGESFTASPGVTVQVRADRPKLPCVRVHDAHGDVSEWVCLDPDKPPVDPDPDNPDPNLG